jgi:hypothetical protein
MHTGGMTADGTGEPVTEQVGNILAWTLTTAGTLLLGKSRLEVLPFLWTEHCWQITREALAVQGDIPDQVLTAEQSANVGL